MPTITSHAESDTGGLTRRWIEELISGRRKEPDPILAECRNIIDADKSLRRANLAKRLGVSTNTLDSWLSGRRLPKLRDVRRLVALLGLTLPAPVPAEDDDPGCEIDGGPGERP